MAASSTKDTTKNASATEDLSLTDKVRRIIPGLSASTDAPAAGKKRSRKPKSSISAPVAGTAVGHSKDGDKTPLQEGESAPIPEEQEDQIEAKKTSAVEATSKRIRAANKKLQRIATYEEKTEALNADQQRAIASKPVLQSVVKELEELLVILKAEETEDDARNKRVEAQREKQHSRSIAAAVAESQKSSDTLVLLQFLHLHELYSPSGQGFAPPNLPPVVANATGQEVAAVRMLRETLANGPQLPGGYEEASEKLSKLAKGSDDEVLSSVSYRRVKELIDGLTSTAESTPATPTTAAPAQKTENVAVSSAPAGPTDSVTALVDGADDTHTPSFMNASEIEQVPSAEEKVANWADDVEPAAPALAPVAAPAPAATTPAESTRQAAPAPAAAAPQINGTPADSWGIAPASAAGPIDWASEEHSNELPSLPELAPAPVAAAAAQPEADGFQPARGPRRGGGPDGGRGGRGSFRGGEGRGRGGGYRGGPRGPGSFPQGQQQQGGERREGGEWQQRGPREPREGGRGGFNGGENRGRGGRGRGEGRGGRGGPRGAPNAAGEATPNAVPAASAAPAAEKW